MRSGNKKFNYSGTYWKAKLFRAKRLITKDRMEEMLIDLLQIRSCRKSKNSKRQNDSSAE
jgi:predicted NAD/FAD-binding protein